MIKAMLVDDEVLMLKMLESLIDWGRYGIEIVATAGDGMEAMEKYLHFLPRIIITDIKMPKLNGLEFITRVRAIHAETEFIFISAFADFSYAKEAMRLGGANYILKPIDETELERTLRGIVDKINEKETAQKQTEEADKLKAKLLLRDYMKTGLRAGAAAKAYDMLTDAASSFMLLSVRPNAETINEYTELTGMADHHLTYLLNKMRELLRRSFDCLPFEYEERAWIILLFTNNTNAANAAAENLLKFLKDECGISAQAAFSGAAAAIEELPLLYAQVNLYMKFGLFTGRAGVIGCQNGDLGRFEKTEFDLLSRAMKDAVKLRDAVAMVTAVDSVFAMSETAGSEHLRDFYEFCFESTRAMQMQDISFEELQTIEQKESLREFMREAIARFVSNDSSEKKHSVLVEKGIALLEEKYNSNLSLEEICDALSVSKNYFSYLFKHETGISLWVYLTNLRIGKAKLFLETTDMKGYEIAYKVGFDNPSYFAKLFKKHVGQTPNEYRIENTKNFE